MTRLFYILALVGALLARPLFAETPRLEPLPDWVEKTPLGELGEVPVDGIRDGVFYRLFDQQSFDARREDKQYYMRLVQLVVNEAGAENVAQINISFEPTFQQVRLHTLHLWRDGARIDKLADARISFLQQESELADNIVSGDHTLNVILSDIRIGDVLEYSYSVAGQNPFYSDLFGAHYDLQWGVPVGEIRLRVVTENPAGLNYQFVNTDASLAETSEGDWRVYRYQAKSVPALRLDDNTPPWYDPYPTVVFSQLDSWAAVNLWALPLFEAAVSDDAEILAVAEAIRDEAATPAEQLVAALQYVQREVRYLGLEIGENAHVPYAASETLARRYGDCKDKSVLLISLLRALGIDAQAVLVNTEIEHLLADYPPSPWLFDHAIVRAELDGRAYWLDPTRPPQAGPLESLYQADFGFALVLSAGTDALTRMRGTQGEPWSVVNETLDLRGNGAALLDSQTRLTGLEADRQYNQLKTGSLEELRTRYLDYYRSVYGEVEAVTPVAFHREGDALVARESYQLDSFWKNDEAEQMRRGYLRPFNVSDEIRVPERIERTHPYHQRHPVNRRHTITVHLPDDDWRFDTDEKTIDNPHFLFRFSQAYDAEANTLSLQFEYQSRAESVPASAFLALVDALEQASDQTDYGIRQSTGATATQGTLLEYLPAIIIFAALLGAVTMVIWWRIELRLNPFTGNAVLFPVTPVKFLVMNLITLGVYSLYWLYRNWRYIRDDSGDAIMPLARAIFAPFWYYPLYRRLAQDHQNRQGAPALMAPPLAVLLALVYFAMAVAANAGSWGGVLSTLSFLPLLPLVVYIYHLNDRNPEAQIYHSRLRVRHALLVPITLPLLLFSHGSELALTPPAEVVKGDRLWRHDVAFMQRNGVLQPGEKIVHFYSNALFFMQNDGNGVTDQGVFSYWRDADGLYVETARFEDIAEVKTTWAETPLDNTLLTILRKDGSEFVMFVSAMARGDRPFVKRVTEGWEAMQAAEAAVSKGHRGDRLGGDHLADSVDWAR